MCSMDFRVHVATSQAFDEDRIAGVTQRSNFMGIHGFISALHFESDGHDLRMKIHILEFYLDR